MFDQMKEMAHVHNRRQIDKQNKKKVSFHGSCLRTFHFEIFRHHSYRVFERLAFVAEPNPNHLTLVAKLVGQSCDFRSRWMRIPLEMSV